MRWLIEDGSSVDVFRDACLFDLLLGWWLMMVNMEVTMVRMLISDLFLKEKRS